MSSRAWVTLATNDSYGLGALVLAHSLRRAGSAYPAVVIITPSVTDAMSGVFAEVVTVDVLDSGDAAHLALLQRPELGITFTKIHCWNLTQYEKCVFLDADTLVVQNCDELFEREELSAAPDVGWPDCFNSGVFVFKPSAETYSSLITFAQERGSFDGGDQGLLNSYFSDWAHGDINKHLPFLYNVTSAAFYSYLPALKHYGQNLKIIHFIGAGKPWLQQYNWQSRNVDAPEHLRELLQLWWDLFVSQVHSQLDTSMVEVEDVPPAIVPREENFFYTEPRSDYNHYKPTIDPHSEFHWHRPESQIPDPEVIVPSIDMTQFHDPWDIYQGHIPEITGEKKDTSPYSQEDQPDIRRHVWEHPTKQFQRQMESHLIETQYTDTQHNIAPNNELVVNESHHNEYHHNQSQHEHNTTQNTWPQTHSIEFSEHCEYHHNQQHHDSYHIEHYGHNKQIGSPSPYNYDQQSFNQCTNSNYPSGQEYHMPEHSDRFQLQSADHQESLSSRDYNTQHLEAHRVHQHESPPSLHDENEEISSQVEYHTNEQHSHHNYKEITSESQTDQNQQAHYLQKQLELFAPPLRKRVEYIYCVHLDHERERNRQREKLKGGTTLADINGFGLETEIDEDFIIPRHPYDGFYLRHRMTIDSRGRKMCTHEIPPTPSPSPSISPPESPIFFDAISEFSSQEETFVEDNDLEYSGVAGNLARVSPGEIGTQREALDELTRRQGWEAGNIDYMGADSFANIWAKISQTLSQPPPSPPKEPTPPPKEVDVPQVEASEDKEPEISSVTAVEEVMAESPAEPEPKETPLVTEESSKIEVPAETVVSSDTSVPVQSIETAPLDTPASEVVEPPVVIASAGLPVSAEPSSQVVEPSLQKAEAVPTETAIEAPIPKETSTGTEAPVSDAVASEEATVPVESAAIPIDSSVPELPAEIPVPVVEAVLEEVKSSSEPAPVKQEEIPAPVIEASKLETSNVDSESVAAAEAASKAGVSPEVDTVPPTEAPQAEAPVASSESPAPASEALSSPPVVEPVKSVEKPPKPDDIPLAGATDSPPLANTPSKEEIPSEPAAKSTEEAAQETRL